jgi:hypothetical protein
MNTNLVPVLCQCLDNIYYTLLHTSQRSVFDLIPQRDWYEGFFERTQYQFFFSQSALCHNFFFSLAFLEIMFWVHVIYMFLGML